MNVIDPPQSQAENQRNTPRKRWISVIILICAITLICVLITCILGVRGLVQGMKPKTNPVFYDGASISHMVVACEPERYYSPEDWMAPVPGTDLVTALYYSKSGPAPDAFYAYVLFIQIDPERVVVGYEISIPGDGIQPFLLETRAPYMVCSSDLTGSLMILDVTDTTLRAQLDITGLIDGNNWEYNGEVEFNQAPIPK